MSVGPGRKIQQRYVHSGVTSNPVASQVALQTCEMQAKHSLCERRPSKDEKEDGVPLSAYSLRNGPVGRAVFVALALRRLWAAE